MSEKQCPYCGEMIKLEAIKCKHCYTMLNEQPAREKNALEKTSSALSKFGTVCIWLLTVPIIAGFFWGVYGFAIALFIGVCVVVSSVAKWKQ